MAIRIAVDAGHDSYTAGKRTPPLPQGVDINNDGIIDVAKGDSIREHIANTGVANSLFANLQRCGFEAIRSGFDDSNAKDDGYVSVIDRQQNIKDAGCDYSVSIHFNAYGDGESFNSAEGVGVFIHSIYPKDSRNLATKVLAKLILGTKQKNRGIKEAQFALCNCQTMDTKASILVECAFMTNLNEALNMMGNDDYWEETACEISKGFCDYVGVDYTFLYIVQVGAFRSRSNAENMVEELKNNGFADVFIRTNHVEDKPMYRLQVGAFTVKENAEKMLERVKAKGYGDAFIRTI